MKHGTNRNLTWYAIQLLVQSLKHILFLILSFANFKSIGIHNKIFIK
jgi:hypothetical protein